jgi:hypothetical protein
MATNTNYDRDAEIEDGIQHGLDDDPNNDAEKGAAIGGLGGLVTGAIAGSAAGPVGTIAGAVIGGIAGAALSGAAVAAVDAVDNDDNVTGLGSGITTDTEARANLGDSEAEAIEGRHAMPHDTGLVDRTAAPVTYNDPITGLPTSVGAMPPVLGNGVPGVQTGGHAIDGTPDTRGVSEKVADAVTGDRIDDKTGKPVR